MLSTVRPKFVFAELVREWALDSAIQTRSCSARCESELAGMAWKPRHSPAAGQQRSDLVVLRFTYGPGRAGSYVMTPAAASWLRHDTRTSVDRTVSARLAGKMGP
jgi:hypothetical protein